MKVACLHFVRFMLLLCVKSFCKKRSENIPNDLIYISTYFATHMFFHNLILSFSHTINNLALRRPVHNHHIQSPMGDYSKHFQLQISQSQLYKRQFFT